MVIVYRVLLRGLWIDPVDPCAEIFPNQLRSLCISATANMLSRTRVGTYSAPAAVLVATLV